MIVHFIYANVPIVCGGRAGWKRTVFFSHTYRSQYFVWWKGGVEIDGLGRCNCMLQDQRHIARTRTGANSIAWWKDGWERTVVLRTRAGAILFVWWKNRVEKNGFVTSIL